MKSILEMEWNICARQQYHQFVPTDKMIVWFDIFILFSSFVFRILFFPYYIFTHHHHHHTTDAIVGAGRCLVLCRKQKNVENIPPTAILVTSHITKPFLSWPSDSKSILNGTRLFYILGRPFPSRILDIFACVPLFPYNLLSHLYT